MDDVTFERGLARLAAGMMYPETPQLRARVVAAVERAPRRRAVSLEPSLGLAIAASVIAAIIALAVALSVPTSRDAMADFFGVKGSTIEFLPTPQPGVTPTPIDASRADIALVATPFSLADVERALGFAPLRADGEEPRATYALRYGDQLVVVLRYDDFDLWQARLQQDVNFGKDAPPGVRVEDVFVDGQPARWVTGGPHFAAFVDAGGERIEASSRLVERSTLIWNEGDVFLRMETTLAKEEALDVARSVR